MKNIAIFTIGILSALASVLPAGSSIASGRQILILVTSADQMANRKKTGLWLEEYAVPYLLFLQAGFKVTVASPQGGKAPIDPGSMKQESTWEEAIAQLDNTKAAKTVSAKDFDAIFIPGGHGTMFDLPNNREVKRLLAEFEEQHKVIAAVCHGPAAFVGAKKAEGGIPLVSGKTITSFTDEEEYAVERNDAVPFLLESQLRKEGAHFIDGQRWASHVEVDGQLVTGQNPASSEAVAKAVISLLR